MSLANLIFIGISLIACIIPFNTVHAQIKIYSSEGETVIGGTAEEFQKAGSQWQQRDWNRVDGPGPMEKEAEPPQGLEEKKPEEKKPEQKQEQSRQVPKETRKVKKSGVECFTVPDNGLIFRMCKDRFGQIVSMEKIGEDKGYAKKIR